MEIDHTLERANRVLLVHFDSYSTALVFARWPDSLLWPSPLSGATGPMPAPAAAGAGYDGNAVRVAAIARLGLNPEEVMRAGDFDQWVATDEGPVRVHLLRFTTFEAPKPVIETHGGVFRPISALRGSDPLELGLAREVFNLIVGAGGGRG